MTEKAINGETPANNKFWLLRVLEKSSHWSSWTFERAAIIGVAIMIAATMVDVIGAKIFHKPLRAGTELVYFSQVIAIAGALAYTKIAGYHIRMEFIDSLPRRITNVVRVIVSILSLGLIILLAWKGFEYGQALMASHDVSAAARVPIYPFVFWMALSCIPLCLVLLNDLVKSLVEALKR